MHRKDFIKTLSLGLLGAYSCKSQSIFESRKTFGIQLYTVRNEISKNLESLLEKLGNLAYTDLEIYGYDDKFFGKKPAEFKNIVENLGLKVISSHHLAGFKDKGRGTLSENWEKSVDDLNFLGAKYMVFSYLFPEERTTENYHRLPQLLQNCGEITKKAGIKMAYHNHDFEFENFEGKTVYDFILQNTDPDLVNMELDLYWISKAGFDPVKYFEKYPGRFPLWHVKDMDSQTKNFTEIGSGTIDFRRLFEHKKLAGLQHWFVEQDESNSPFESIKASRDYLIRENY